MTPAELDKLATMLYGPGWQGKLSRKLGMSRRQINRYANGHAEIPKLVAVAVKALAKQA